ncbi:alcohol dehydrogenase [Sulfolobus sp. A20-N-F6]|uniref:zinc-dependent dehydrogenase n=1 Tax=Saccharolobus sp. A20 TaxID=1891280 RepID=UPI000846140C|nr:zinc-dependent dehydrogenase [Sulfolobus sp. A20]TRM76342.1 alcohol dehydrogenase [Sulfolobus sp. E5]TRM76449.1 alcohol dehydrogenase [Sulfolobus sp. A20-N-F8]TRM76962.1 alcohol dehydrogenase [Sulfolobus sp. B5]TRM81200.1 alcohol dehydrogenase [Sulfolobus sp. D5]TRM83304.1 alcohol dehydrogenase [Sulfolobus sp. A20-N-F6]TRM89753.1 alcohol dehydrogenase [Sulfolobus sp. C3]
MKSVVLENGRAVIKELPIPKLQEGDILVEMKACGLCGTDIEKICGQYTASQPIIGHEPAGIIKESTVDWLKVGDRVFAHHHVPCYECYYCKKGSPTMCPYYRKTNLDPGGFSEYFRVPSWNVKRGGVLKLPDNVTFEEASFIEPLATVIRAQKRVKIMEGDSVFIVGSGPMGLLHAMMAKVNKAGTVIISDISEFRVEYASKIPQVDHSINSKKMNVVDEVKKLTDGRGADISIIASGSPSAILSGLYATRKGGRVLLFGVPYKGTTLNYDISDLLNNEISVISSNAAVEEDTNEALKVIASKSIDVNSLITHRFPLDEFNEAVRVAKEGKSIKVIIYD